MELTTEVVPDPAPAAADVPDLTDVTQDILGDPVSTLSAYPVDPVTGLETGQYIMPEFVFNDMTFNAEYTLQFLVPIICIIVGIGFGIVIMDAFRRAFD